MRMHGCVRVCACACARLVRPTAVHGHARVASPLTGCQVRHRAAAAEVDHVLGLLAQDLGQAEIRQLGGFEGVLKGF